MGNRIHTEVIHCWQRKGVDVEILCFDAGLRHPNYEVLDGIPVYRLPIGHFLKQKALNRLVAPFFHYPYFFGMLTAYRRFLEAHRYDFAHVETAFPLGVVASLLPRRLHPPMAVTLPGADVMAEPAYDYGYARYAGVRRLLPMVWRRSALVRADSRSIRRQAIRLGCPDRKAVAIPYNITDGDFPPADVPLAAFKAAARAEVLERHNLAPHARIVLSLSRLHPFKGVEFLVKAAPSILAGVPEAVFLIAGPRRQTATFGDYAGYLEEVAQTLDVTRQVRLIGGLPHDDVRLYLAAADVVVVPSVVEALNRVAVEAAAVSTPSVVTRTTGIGEYMAEHGYGLLVEPRSAESIAAALRILLADEERRHALGSRGPQLAAQFRSQAIADALLTSYQSALCT